MTATTLTIPGNINLPNEAKCPVHHVRFAVAADTNVRECFLKV